MKTIMSFLVLSICLISQSHGSEPFGRAFRGIKEMKNIWSGGGEEKILQNVINKHAAFCRKMGIIFQESNSPMDNANVTIPHIWVYYYINAKEVEKDDLCRIYIAAYEELERLVNEDQDLNPYLEQKRYRRGGKRLLLGFTCVDENFVKQEIPDLSFFCWNDNDQLEMRYREYGVKHGISDCVIRERKEEIGDYYEIKKRLGF